MEMNVQLIYLSLILLMGVTLMLGDNCPESCQQVDTDLRCEDEANPLSSIPACVQSLDHLESMRLNHNNIPTLQSWAFRKTSHLKHLYFSNNGITAIEPGLFTQSAYVQTIDLSHNSLQDIPHGVFKTPHGLAYLRELDLSYNDITSIDSGVFEGLTSLRSLRLDGNRIQHIDDDAFSHLWQLQKISLRHCDLVPSRFYAALETLSQFHLSRIFLGENDFGCNCDWLELVRMLNKYKVAIVDVEDTPSCDDTDIKCDFSVHQTLQDLEIIREIHISKEVLHVNLHRHTLSLIMVATLNVIMLALVFAIQCLCRHKRCCSYDYINIEEDYVTFCPCIAFPKSGSETHGCRSCWYGCEDCCVLRWRDGTSRDCLGKGILSDNLYETAYDADAESRILSHFVHEAMNHVGTIRETLQQPNYPVGCHDCQSADLAHGGEQGGKSPRRLHQTCGASPTVHSTCIKCQETAKNMNILFNDPLNLEYVNQGHL